MDNITPVELPEPYSKAISDGAIGSTPDLFTADQLRAAVMADRARLGSAVAVPEFGWFKLHESNDQWGAYQVSAAYASDPGVFKLYSRPPAAQVGTSELARDFPPMGGLTECDMGDSDE